MKKVLKMIGIALLVIILLIVALLFWLSKQPSVPNDYTKTVKTGGAIEAKYMAMGSHEVSYFESATLNSFQKYEIYYPSDIDQGGPLPVVVFVNGTGVKGSKYPALQKHMASWGFITIATEEEYAWNGFSAEMSVRYLELLNEYEGEINGNENIFFGKVNLNCIGITGHSQGGFGVVNAITGHRNKDRYQAAVILSSNAQTNGALLWEADATLIEAPTLIIGSTGNTDAMLASLESLQSLYNQIPENVPKVMTRRNDADHGQMLYYGDGYVTAWFMWQLRGDREAARAFIGEYPEILNNVMYQDARINLK